MLCDLLWSDPDEFTHGWGENERGVSFVFGADVVKRFIEKHDLDLICRGHQVVEDGYEFFAKRQLLTVFSAPDYCGEYVNKAAVLLVDNNLVCSLTIINNSIESTNEKRLKHPLREGKDKDKSRKRPTSPPKLTD